MGWMVVRHDVTKLSAKVGNLKSNTKYKLRIRALNNKNSASEYSAEVEAETQHGAAVATLAATGAFIGGTLGGPVLGAVGIGGAAGVSAAIIR